MRFEYKTIMNLPQYVPTDAIMYLSGVGINIVRGSNRMLYEYVIDINGYISDRINNCSKLFPIWLNWQYVRDLFVMPNGRTQEGTRAAAEAYYSNRMNYPYQSYINWKVEPDQGNILLNDKKFVTLLYKQHHDNFTDLSKVTDAGEKIKNSIYDFVADAKKVVLVVDCENSDPYKLTATLNNLDTDEIAKISKIILYNDIHASTAWGLLTNYAKGIEVEHIMTERVKDNKSLVDIRLSTGVCREFFANGVDSFMLVSSDSDYWDSSNPCRTRGSSLCLREESPASTSSRRSRAGRYSTATSTISAPATPGTSRWRRSSAKSRNTSPRRSTSTSTSCWTRSTAAPASE